MMCDLLNTQEQVDSDDGVGEETRSSYTYSNEYLGPKPIGEQISIIAEIFDLDPTNAFAYARTLPELPECAEGWFAVPSMHALAQKYFPEVSRVSNAYCLVVESILAKILERRRPHLPEVLPFRNQCIGQITPEQFRVSLRTAQAANAVLVGQTEDIRIIAAQLGMRHRGRSGQEAKRHFMRNEFGLMSYMVGSILLSHPHLLSRWVDLSIDCPGDEFDGLHDSVRFSRVPSFSRHLNGTILFDARSANDDNAHFGSATGFVPNESI